VSRLRSRSLFWTFAGAFLLVLVVAAILQTAMVLLVVRPFAIHLAEGEATLQVHQAADRIAASDRGDETIRHILHGLQRERWGEGILAFVSADHRIVPGGYIPQRARPRMEALLEGTLVPRPPRGPRRGPPTGTPEEPSATSEESGQRVSERRLRIVTRAEVPGGGEVVALRVRERFPWLPPGAPTNLLLFLPLALVIAGGAGAVMFRSLVRRIRALEVLAGRVAEGDLEARVTVSAPDELGRLGATLNRMTERLAEAKRTLETHDTQRRRLLADISHELATPLTSIRGFAETLLNPDIPLDDGERTTYVRNVLEEAERLDALIQELFELTRLEAPGMEFVREPLDWAALCANTVERFKPRFRQAGLELAWGDPAGEAWVSGDGRRLEQVLENLLTNALRYVPEGGSVRVSLGRADELPGTEGWRLEVADDGPGIPEADLPHVFERFYRADPARGAGGTGLGLAIVQEIVLRHGGRVIAVPGDPKGIVFRVDLPVLRDAGAGSASA